MHPMPIPPGYTLERPVAREQDHESPALLRDRSGHVVAEVQTIDGGELGFAAMAARVRAYLRVT